MVTTTPPRIRNIIASSSSSAAAVRRSGGASTSSTSSSSVPEADGIRPPEDANDDDSSSSSSSSRTRSIRLLSTTTTTIARRLFPSVLLVTGLVIFVNSFFLSRKPFVSRSSCHVDSGGGLLLSSNNMLGMSYSDVEYLRKFGFLSDIDHHVDDDDAAGRGEEDAEEEDYDYDYDYDRGCWTPRYVDSAAVIVVDALRFDFARDRLPLSVGSRLFPPRRRHTSSSDGDGGSGTVGTDKEQQEGGIVSSRVGTSRLVRFVADPPTVTMQRLKGLTTGGLPTFADITGSFGGASVDEDSWVEQLRDAPWDRRSSRGRGRRRRRSRRGGGGRGDDGRLRRRRGRRRRRRPRIAFVGDDTWVDLFPTQFDDCHPYPSFNTRDLDTVDDGCMSHLPRLLDGLVGMRPDFEEEEEEEDEGGDGGGVDVVRVNGGRDGDNSTTSSSSFELIVAHFLGVDHVGHTYGPNDPHMERKLHQMDVVLSEIFGMIDDAPSESCVVAFVLGDHGMTEDGNHGGGTSDEVNAGLFAHYSPGCGDGTAGDGETTSARGEELDARSARAFDSIHQIDLVPTISIMMGLPIPYANIGGLVPDLLPPRREGRGRRRTSSSSSSSRTTTATTPHVATALALNAAQVWNYLHAYSRTSRDLPADRMRELKEILDSASLVYRDAISQSRKHMEENGDSHGEDVFDSTAYRQACALFKLFLAESTDLGKQVWTQFNEGGMQVGIGVMVVAWIMAIPLWKGSVRNEFVGKIWVDDVIKSMQNDKDKSNASSWHFSWVELATSITFMTFTCGVLTFGNSYIEHEREIVAFFLSVLCLLAFRRWYFATPAGSKSTIGSIYPPLIVVLCSRTNDIFVTGHGLDPSIRLHPAHHPAVFLSSLLVLTILRIRWLGSLSKTTEQSGITSTPLSTSIDIIAILFLACSWWDKRSLDHSRTGFVSARIALAAIFWGFVHSILSLSKQWKFSSPHSQKDTISESRVDQAHLTLFRAMLFLVIVTGPSMASTAVLIIIQCAALRRMMDSTRAKEVAAPAMAAIWRLSIRQAFFASNHHCSFNRLQFSAAFVATNSFQFYIAGSSLFMNTFGYELLGSCIVLVYCHSRRASSRNYSAGVWEWFVYFQWTEMLASCLSVSVMKRHLMVWAIFAPRFAFAAVFTALVFTVWVLNALVENLVAPPPVHTKLHQHKQQIS